MDKKKAKSNYRLTTIQQIIIRILGFCLAYLLCISLTNWAPVKKDLDFAVRKRAKKVLVPAFSAYQIETIAANPAMEKHNLLTIGYISKEAIRRNLQEQQIHRGSVDMTFYNFQLRIREFFFTPMLILVLGFMFFPISWKPRLGGMFAGLVLLAGLLTLKLRAITRFEIRQIYAPGESDLLQVVTPFFSSPGLVFGFILLLWMVTILPFVNLKKLLELLPD